SPRICIYRSLRRSSAARSASRSQRRWRSTRAARRGGQERARCPVVSAVRTDGSCVVVTVRGSRSSAPASASQADLLRDLQIIQAAISPTTSRISRAQPRAPSPWDSAEAGGAAADVGGEGGGAVGGEGGGG